MWLACKTSNDAMPFCNKQGESQVLSKPSLVKDQNSSLWRRRISPFLGYGEEQIKIYMFLSFGSACPSRYRQTRLGQFIGIKKMHVSGVDSLWSEPSPIRRRCLAEFIQRMEAEMEFVANVTINDAMCLLCRTNLSKCYQIIISFIEPKTLSCQEGFPWR